MEVRRHTIYDTRLGLYVTAHSLESAHLGVAKMNRVAGYNRYVARTITEIEMRPVAFFSPMR
jgi:hypothetical protein